MTTKPFITKPGVYRELDETVYHADPVIGGSLSSTGAKQILKSPMHYQHYVQVGMAPRTAFDNGSIVHREILGTGADIAVLDFPNFTTKAAREARDEARTLGKTPVLEKDYAPLLEVANDVLDHPEVGAWFHGRPEDSEVSIFHKHPEFGVWMRGRVDRILTEDEVTLLIDLKTTQDADPTLFGRTAAKFGYDLQRAWYTAIWKALHPDTQVRFIHVIVGLSEPHTLSVVELDDDFTWTGDTLMEKALARYAECVKAGEWPGYPTTITEVGPPTYHLYSLEDDEEIEV